MQEKPLNLGTIYSCATISGRLHGHSPIGKTTSHIWSLNDPTYVVQHIVCGTAFIPNLPPLTTDIYVLMGHTTLAQPPITHKVSRTSNPSMSGITDGGILGHGDAESNWALDDTSII